MILNLENINNYKRILWKDDSKYYMITIQKTLFGELSIVKEWGRLYSHLGNSKIFYFDMQKELELEILNTHKKRIYRGYQLIYCK